LVTPGGLGANVIVIAADEVEELAKVTSDPTATIALGQLLVRVEPFHTKVTVKPAVSGVGMWRAAAMGWLLFGLNSLTFRWVGN
jgi:hypothetical protein